jgi:NAD(P)-dependent dehydrogenase (short-subunit alcohol dehydrogenase family)
VSPVAIVTASDSGIGQESAKELAENGFDVGITYHEDEAGARETHCTGVALGHEVAAGATVLLRRPQAHQPEERQLIAKGQGPAAD